MKLKVRPSTKTIAVMINTPYGPRSFSTGTKDMATAKEIAAAAHVQAVEMAARALNQQMIHKLTVGGTPTVDQAIAEWLEWMTNTAGSDRTVENHSIYVRMWARTAKVRTMKIAAIREKHISDWVNANDGAHLGTRRVRLTSVRSLFHFCSVRQYVQGDPSQLVKIKAKLLTHEQKEPREKVCFTPEEFDAVVTYLRKRLSALIGNPAKTSVIHNKINRTRFWLAAMIIGRYSGLRLGDICSLEWACFAKAGKLIVHTDKRDRRVELPIGKELFEGVSLIPTSAGKLCFPEQDAVARSRSRSNHSVEFMRILEKAGVTGKSFHSLRHTLASELDAKGDSIEDIAEALGHGSKESTETYIHRKKD